MPLSVESYEEDGTLEIELPGAWALALLGGVGVLVVAGVAVFISLRQGEVMMAGVFSLAGLTMMGAAVLGGMTSTQLTCTADGFSIRQQPLNSDLGQYGRDEVAFLSVRTLHRQDSNQQGPPRYRLVAQLKNGSEETVLVGGMKDMTEVARLINQWFELHDILDGG